MNDALRTQLLSLGYQEATPRCRKHPHASEGAALAQLRSITREQERKPDRKELKQLSVYLAGVEVGT
jgi:hypothetical protein